jgi:uncharacterized membrane protein YvbJ
MKKCPFCAEEIQDEALVCKHCGRDINAPQPKDLSTLKSKLESEIQKYMSYGYELVSRMDTAAILERRAPINWATMIALILLLWPVAIIYAIPGTRKAYRAQLNVTNDGMLTEFGGTISEYERDKSKATTTGWILFAIVVILFICIIISSMNQ